MFNQTIESNSSIITAVTDLNGVRQVRPSGEEDTSIYLGSPRIQIFGINDSTIESDLISSAQKRPLIQFRARKGTWNILQVIGTLRKT